MTEKQQNRPKLDNSDDEADQAEGGPDNSKLTKAQKNKLREKRKKQEKAQAKLQENQKKQEAPGQKEQEKIKQSKKQEKPKKGGKPMNAAALLAKKKLEVQQAFEAEQLRKKKQFDDEQERIIREAELEKKRIEDEKKARIAEVQKKIKEEKKKGIYVKEKDKQKLEMKRAQLEAQRNQGQEKQERKKSDDEDATQEEIKQYLEQQAAKKKRQECKILKDDKIYFARKEGQYRSPVCCILGHVDTGKTTLLDKIRRTNVQEGEAGGITQQIGATFFPQDKLIEEVSKCESHFKTDVNVPGLLIIDTPGHQSFSNLRSRGSSLCDIAILVIDLQHGLQNQTLESLELLSKRKTPFVVALNKIDRSYGWKAEEDSSSYLTLKKQKAESLHDYETKLNKIIVELNSKGYNAALYWENPDPSDYISLIPTSGITGEGIPDLLAVIVKYCLTMENIQKRIRVKKDVFNCTVMEVKMLEGYGTTIDALLVDGHIKKDDQIVLLGFEGPIITKVKALLTPHPMKEMRIKDQYLHHKQMWAANGLKICATGLDSAVAGTPLIVANTEDQVQDAKAIVLNEFQAVKKKIKLENLGVGVAASTLGSLEALLEYLSKEKVPVSYVSVGPVSKQDVMKAMKSTLSEIPERRKKEYACLLVFDIKVLADAQKYAEQNQIKIFTANIIYHLTDFFTKYVAEVKEERKMKEGKEAVFPCVLKQVTTFRKSDPIVIGVDVEAGILKIGTPLVVFRQNEKGDKQPKLGIVESIEHNHKKLKEARKNTGSVAISIGGDPSIQSGKQFDEKDKLVSLISRRSIDCLKEHYRNEATKEDWALVIELKKYFNCH